MPTAYATACPPAHHQHPPAPPARPATRSDRTDRTPGPPYADTGPTRKATTLRNTEPTEPRVARESERPHPSAAVRRRHFSPAADAIGSELDLRLTGRHVVHALAPGFCDAASVYLLQRWLLEEQPRRTADPPQIEARRLALRIGADATEDWEHLLPADEVLVFPRETPYARAIATGQTQLLDGVDEHTVERLRKTAPDHAGVDALLRTASFLIVPLRLRGTAVGFIACTRGPDREPFARGEAVAVESLGSRACVALDNARRYERERRTALAIRRSLLPDTGQAFDGCRVAHGYRPAGQDNVIGGDWFDVLPRAGRRLGLIVGDAMGHGPESAVAMIQLRTAVRTLAGLDIGPSELLHRLDGVAGDTPGAPFATCMYAEWDADGRTCTFVGAGHPPPLVRGPGGPAVPVSLATPGLPLGLGTGRYEPTVLHLSEPALLLLYSDGLVESRTHDIDQGITRLARALDDGAQGIPDPGEPDALPSLCRRLLAGSGCDDVTDDRTLLLAELTPGRE
ncbi:PP2C family protein-serine/threonine phosphatase [Streptomyces sp. NRRL S-340]|uniref:PP2C family protein-serine/threonine phosphatase n=1 Tax=Streptomyces sp. NRRL S-340 TaxID=1463901 RepID=UPI00056B6FF5|nr:SpoIIE family protein phosphatase [Streptomyces sp. NRRL S-340]